MDDRFKQRLNAELEKGKIWRAKEMLRGRIGQPLYDTELYAEYGKLLFQVEDYYEAGKFLFLGGV